MKILNSKIKQLEDNYEKKPDEINPDKIINNPVKATLFGKFYEEIILKWLEKKRRIYYKRKKQEFIGRI